MTSVASVLAVLGVVLIVLGAIPPTRAVVPWGVNTGIALVVLGMVLYVVLQFIPT